MLHLAIKNLIQERGRLFISLGGVAAALILVLLLDGIFAGSSEQIVAYPAKTDADVWVMQDGVSNMHMATSILPTSLEDAMRVLPDVQDVTPILYMSTFLERGQQRWLSYVVGLRPGASPGGPWAMAQGTASPGRGEAVIPRVLARKAKVGLGGQIDLLGRTFRVAGLSDGTFSIANSITFVSYDDLEELLSSPGAASYFLVKKKPGVSNDVLADHIKEAVPNVNAMTREAFIASDRSMARQMGVDIIQVMTLVGFVVGVLVIGLTVYTATVHRAREYGIIKALGAKTWYLLGLVVLQTLVIAGIGLAVAIVLAYLARPVVQTLAPEIALTYPGASIARLVLVTLAIAALASLLPAYRMALVEPAAVFKE